MGYVKLQNISYATRLCSLSWRAVLSGLPALSQFLGWSGLCLAVETYFPANIDASSRSLSLQKILNLLSAVKFSGYLTSQSYLLIGRHHVSAHTWMNLDWSMMGRYWNGFLMRKSGRRWRVLTYRYLLLCEYRCRHVGKVPYLIQLAGGGRMPQLIDISASSTIRSGFLSGTITLTV